MQERTKINFSSSLFLSPALVLKQEMEEKG